MSALPPSTNDATLPAPAGAARSARAVRSLLLGLMSGAALMTMGAVPGVAQLGMVAGALLSLGAAFALALAAVRQGHAARRDIRGAHGALTGDTQAQLGLLLGYATLALGTAAVLAVALVGYFAASAVAWAH